MDNNPNNYASCYYPNMTIPAVQPTPTTIGSDEIPTVLNYVINNWDTSNNWDIWEEQQGVHSYEL